MTWGETLDSQKSSLRWDIKRTIKILCKQLSEIGEECFLVTCNVNNGWVSHLGSIYGDDFINEHSYIPYRFLDYCRESVDTADQFTPKPKQTEQASSVPSSSQVDNGEQIRIQMLPTFSDDEELYQMVQVETEEVKTEPVNSDYDLKDQISEQTTNKHQQHHGKSSPDEHENSSKKQHKNPSPELHKNSSSKQHRKKSGKPQAAQLLRQSVERSPKKRAGVKLPFWSPEKKYKLDKISAIRPSIASPFKKHNKRKDPRTVIRRTVHSCALCNQTFKHDNNYVKHILGDEHQRNLHRTIVCHKCNREFDSNLELYHHVTECKGNNDCKGKK